MKYKLMFSVGGWIGKGTVYYIINNEDHSMTQISKDEYCKLKYSSEEILEKIINNK